jgi:hypothetical protein
VKKSLIAGGDKPLGERRRPVGPDRSIEGLHAGIAHRLAKEDLDEVEPGDALELVAKAFERRAGARRRGDLDLGRPGRRE